MHLLIFSALAAVQAPLAFTPSEPKNFGPSRYILPTMPREIANQPVDVRLGIELLIDPAGTPKNCRVLDAGNSPAMADWFCENMIRISRFFPARDQHGIAIHSYYTYWKTFGFSNVAPHTTATPDAIVQVKQVGASIDYRSSRLALLIDTSGKVEGCKILKSSGIPTLDTSACALTKLESFPQTRDGAGDLVRTVRIFSVGYRNQ